MHKGVIRGVLLTAAFVAAWLFAQGPAAAQGNDGMVLKTGTTLRYEGVQVRQGSCWEYESYEQYIKVAGRVILPETGVNVFSFIESWGRDSGTQVLRLSPNGDAFVYYLGAEYNYTLRGPAGTFVVTKEPGSGETLRLEIVKTGITLTLVNGDVYEDVTRINVSCTSCGPEPLLMESRWHGREHPFPVLLRVENQSCGPRWLWLVNVTRK